MLKKYSCLLMVSIISIISCDLGFAEGESSTAKPKAANTPSIGGGDGDFSNESLFTGDVAFSVPITGIGGINIALNYNSNIHKLVHADNKDAQAGWVGLGWSLNLGSIVADINGTRDVFDDKYFYVSAAGSSELIFISGNDFMLKEYQYWKITRSLDGNGNLIGWTIILDEGTKMRLGNYNKTTSSFVFDTTFTKATRFMLGWDGVVCNPLNDKYSSASFISYQWDLSDIEDIAGNHTTISYQRIAEVLSANSVSTTIKYSQESHPLKITDWSDRSVEFVLGNLTTAEYVTPPDKIIQRLFERKYLSKIVVKDPNNSVVQQIVFDYSVLDIFNQSASKRYLTSITVQDANNNSLTPTNFGYYTTSGSLGENPGALKSITYPNGGKVEYTYTYQALSNVALDFTQTEDNYTLHNESLFSGSDFYVVKLANNRLRVYRWGTLGWFVDNTFPITAAVADYWVRNDFVVVYVSTTSGEALLKVAKRNNDGWIVTDITIVNNQSPGSAKVIAASSNFFLVAHNLLKYECGQGLCKRVENLSIVRFDGNSWITSDIGNIPLGKLSENADIHLVGSAGRDYFTLQYCNDPNGNFLQDCRVYVRNGDSWALKFGFQPDPGNWGNFDGHAFYLFAGSDYFITYLWRHPNHPEHRRIKMYHWPFNSIEDSLVYSNIDARASIYTGENFFITIGGSEITSSGYQTPILLHSFNGNSSSSYPYSITNIGNLFTTTYKHTRLALGKDYVSIGWITGNEGKLGIIKNVNGQWNSSYVAETINNLGSDSYVTPVNNGITLFTEWYSTSNYHKVHAYKEQNNNWIFNTELDNVTLTSGLYDAPTFTQPGFQFLADVIKPGTTGDIISHGFTEGNKQGGSALFAGNPADYPVVTKTVTDAMGNRYETNYIFENGVYDHDLNFAKYNKVTVTPPHGDNGKTISYFYNHLGPGQAEEFVYAVNYKELDGMPYKVKVYKYNDDENPISTTTNFWSAYAINAANGVYHKRLIKTENDIDGVTNIVQYEYNNTNGQVKKITEPVKVATDLYGLRDRVTEITYAYEQYPAIQTLNMQSQIYERRIISKGSSSSTVSVFADGPDITDYNQFSVLYNQNVNYEAIVSGGYFCVGTTQGGDDIIPKKYSDASGSFHANTGITYYLTAYTFSCSPPPHPCEVWVIGRVTYYQSSDPDEVIFSQERTEYDVSNNYLLYGTSVYDGVNWIAANTITNRNSNGSLTESYNVDGVYSAAKYGYNNVLQVAQISNAKYSETAIADFENGIGEWDDWTTGGEVGNVAHTGLKGWHFDNSGAYTITKTFLPSDLNTLGKYIFSGWVKTSSSSPLIQFGYEDATGGHYPIAVSASGTGEWEYLEMVIDLNPYQNVNYYVMLIRNGNAVCDWDDLRFYPSDAFMNTTTYDPLTLQVTSGTDENNVTTFYEYDSFGRLIKTKNDDGEVLSQTTYYLSREHNGGNFNPNDPNYIRTSTYPDGIGSTPIITTSFTDGLGRTLQSHLRDGSIDIISAVSYDNAGRPNKSYNPYSFSNPNHNYDPNYATISSGYIETQYYSDPLGRVQWRIPQGSSPSTPNKNIESVFGNATLSGVSCYTNDIKQKPATNSVNWITSRSYRDRLGHVVKSSVLDGTSEIQTSTTLYNMLGLPVQVTDPKEMQYNYTYDFLGRLKTKTTPDAGTSKYIYDKAGRLRFMLDADGDAASPDNILYWKYDTFGRVTEKGYIAMNWGDGSALQNYADTDPDYPPTPATWRKKFTYDTDGVSLYLKGRLYKVETNNDNNTDVEVEETFAYNKYGFVTAKNLKVMEVSTQMQSTLYEYDNLGRVIKISYPSRPENLTLQNEPISGTTPVQYEANNNIDAGPDVTINPGASATFKAGTSIHLKPGFTSSNGSTFRAYVGTFTDGGTPTEVVYTYNQRGQISGVGTAANPTYYASYTYKSSGQIENETLNNGQRQVQTTYDIKNRPTQISSPLFTETLTYETDGYGGVGYYHGNIASAGFTYYSGGPAAYQTLFQYDDLGRLKIADNNITALNQYDISNIGYDLNGNILNITKGIVTKTYTYYNNMNRLRNTDGSGNDYIYDANANITASLPKGLNLLVYDPFTQMTKSITVTGTPTKTMSFNYSADNERVLKIESDGTTKNSNLYIRGNNDYPITEKVNQNNSLTDKIYIYGPTGLIAFKDATATYFVIKDHLGSTRVLFRSTGTQYTTYDYSPFGSLMRSAINGDVSYRFTGQEFDDETGLYNFRARLYDDELGIFYAVDPAGQNFSPFSYAGNNPVMYVDKDGRFFWLIPVIIVAVIGGYTGYKIGEAQGASGWGLFAYTFAGAVIGGASGFAGYAVSTSGGMMANTMGLVTSSFSNSVGMSMLSGQNMANINFGLGTYSFGSGKVDWAFGNKNNLGGYLQDLSDVFGVISVANDIYALADVGFKETAEVEKQIQQRVTEEGKDITISDRFTGRNPYDELGENWIEIGDKTNFYEDITTNVSYDKPLLGEWISGAKETGIPSIRYGRWHIGIFDLGRGAQTYIHSDYFNINKNLLWHTLEWLITPERPTGGR